MRRRLPIVLGLALIAAACGGDDSTDGGAVADSSAGGDWPHDFVAETVDGTEIDAAALAGDDLMLWFWAPW